MTDFISQSPAALEWTRSAIERHSSGVFGTLKPAVIWSDTTDEQGELLVPVDVSALVVSVNSHPYLILHEHDPGRPKGQVLECASFETTEGRTFVAAVLGFFAGGDVLRFKELDLLNGETVTSPEVLLPIPPNARIHISTDPREVDRAWLDSVVSDAPILIERASLSHNSADSFQELIRLGIPLALLVWNPFITTIATEAGRDTYLAVHKWVRGLFSRLTEHRAPVLEIRTYKAGCQVAFLIRGKDINRHYAAHEALPTAAAHASKLVDKLRERGLPGRELIYEFGGETPRWFPSYAVLQDGRIVADSTELIAIEHLPASLSLGLSTATKNLE
ncbi:hypothetical protein HP436_12465 [Pseudomonas sp. CrR14]|nr:hypothetical protein [Pseudomonas sp. CrR14]